MPSIVVSTSALSNVKAEMRDKLPLFLLEGGRVVGGRVVGGRVVGGCVVGGRVVGGRVVGGRVVAMRGLLLHPSGELTLQTLYKVAGL